MSQRRTALLVFLVVAAAFAATTGDYLTWSDNFQIEQGHMIVRRAGDAAAIVFPDQLRENNYFRPLQVLSNSIDGLLWGQRWAGFHLTNVLLHAADAVLLFLLGVEILTRARARRGAATAACAAVLWGIHSWKVESVAWIADRCDLLQGFTLLALVIAARELRRHDEQPGAPLRPGVIALASVAFLAGIGAKEVAIVLPALLAACDWLGGHRPGRRARVALYGTLGGLAVVYLVVRRVWLWYPPELSVHYSLLERLLTQLVVTAEDLRGVFWPFDPRASDVVRVHHGLDGAVLLAGSVMLGLGVAAVVAARRGDRRWAWALAWFLICLAPVANLATQRHFRGDRYIYLASWAPILVAVWVAESTLARLAVRRAGRLAVIAFLVVAVPVVYATQVRNFEWRGGGDAFFAREVARSPRFREGLGNLCRSRARERRFDEALVFCRRGWAIDERAWTSTAWQPEGFYQLSFEILTAQGDCDGAAQLTREAIARWPERIELKRRLAALHRRCDAGRPIGALPAASEEP